MWGVFIDSVGEFAGQPLEQLFPRQPRLFRQCFQHLRADRVFELGRRDGFVGTRSDPGLRGFAMAALSETFQQFAESAVQEHAGAGAAEALTQLAQEAADAGLRAASGPSTCGRTFSDAAEKFGDLVPVLKARNREQTQEGRHGWETAAHCVTP